MKDFTIETHLGARYVFPDVQDLELILPESGVHIPIENMALVNASGATLVIPSRIIKRMYMEDTIVWECPA